MNWRSLPLLALMILMLSFTACSRSKVSNDFSSFASNSGLLGESFIPSDVGLVFSYSLRDEQQFANLSVLEDRLGDAGRVSRTVSEGLETELALSGLEFEKDLAPAFGEQYRMVFGTRPSGEGMDAFSTVTLEDPELMKQTLDALVTSEELEFKNLSKVDAYTSEENHFYAGIHQDLLFVTNSADALVTMANLKESDSLWKEEVYQDFLDSVGGGNLIYGLMRPSVLGNQSLGITNALGAAQVYDMIQSQSLVIQAQEDGFAFDVYVQADEEKAKEVDFSFEDIPRSKAYLHKEVPKQNLLGYMESFGLKQSFEQAEKFDEGGGTLKELDQSFQNYMGMSFSEVLNFMDKGIVLAFHDNEQGILPGISIFADVSSDAKAAEDFLSKLDSQLAGLLLVLQTALPGAVRKGSVKVGEETFNQLTIDLSTLEGLSGSETPLPEPITSTVVKLSYGLMGNRLLITTGDVWMEGGETIAESDLYAALSPKLDGVSEGLILLDAEGIAGFASSLSALRQQLNVDAVFGQPDFEDFLEGFLGLISASETEDYQSHIGGFLMVKP